KRVDRVIADEDQPGIAAAGHDLIAVCDFWRDEGRGLAPGGVWHACEYSFAESRKPPASVRRLDGLGTIAQTTQGRNRGISDAATGADLRLTLREMPCPRCSLAKSPRQPQ